MELPGKGKLKRFQGWTEGGYGWKLEGSGRVWKERALGETTERGYDGGKNAVITH